MPSKINLIKGRPDYYLTPTRDFTQYTRDCEEKYWRKETAFDWTQDIRENLRNHLEELSAQEFSRISFMVLPMISEKINHKIELIRSGELPVELQQRINLRPKYGMMMKLHRR